jgi:hypothetical protein
VVRGRPEPDPALVARVGRIALALPEAHEEDAWTGVRWRVRTRTFAHVLVLTADRAREYVGSPGLGGRQAVPVVTFRADGEELLALEAAGWPYLRPGWAPTVVALVLDDATDWTEVPELLTESYRLLAPAKLSRLL